MNTKKMLSLFLAVCLLVGMVPAALAEGGNNPAEPEDQPIAEASSDTLPSQDAAETASTEGTAAEAGTNKITAATKSITEAGTYELEGDVTLEATLNIAAPENGEVIINLNGHTLTGPTVKGKESYAITMDDEANGGHKGTLTLNGGGGAVTGQGGIAAYSGTAVLNNVTVTGTGSNRYPLGAFYGSDVTVAKDCTITGSNNCAIYIVSNVKAEKPEAPTLTVYGNVSTTSATSAAILGNGNDKSHTTISIKPGAKITAADTGMYLPQDGNVTIDGATIKGNLGIGIKSGTLTIKDSTISGTGEYVASDAFNNGITADGSALLVESNPAYKGGMVITISGNSKLSSTNGHAVREIQATDGAGLTSLDITGGTFTSASGKDTVTMLDSDKDKVTITGGTFSTDPSKYVKEGYSATLTDGSYTVGVNKIDVNGSIDNRGYSAINATPFAPVAGKENTYECTVTGTVDLRKYTVLDSVLQEDFESLLQDTPRKGVAEAGLLANEITARYVKDGLELVFADIDFSGSLIQKDSDHYYYIRQINSGMAYAYTTINSTEDNLKAGIKEKSNVGTRALFTDGMTFILANPKNTAAVGNNPVSGYGKDDIIIQIAPCQSDTSTMPTENVTTFVIRNDLKFDESPTPSDDVPVVEAEVKVDGNTAKAAVKDDAVTQKNVEAAAKADGTLTIDAAGSTVQDNVTKVEVTLPNEAITALAENTAVSAKVETNQGTVTLSPAAVAAIKAGATTGSTTSDVILTVEEKAIANVADVATAFEVKVEKVTDSGSAPVVISGLASPIKLSFQIGKDRLDNPKLVYIDGQNKVAVIPDSNYSAGTGLLTGSTTHLSTFGVKADSIHNKVEKGGIGAKITLTATKGKYLTVQVTNSNANSIFTAKVVENDGTTIIYAPIGSKVQFWQTDSAPVFTKNSAAPGNVTGSGLIENVHV